MIVSFCLRIPDRPVRGRAAPTRADGLTHNQRRAAVGAIVAVHAAAAWGLMQVSEVRDAVAQAAPIFVDMVAAPALPSSPLPPPAAPKPVPKITPPVALVTAAASPPTAFVAPPMEVPDPPPAPPIEPALPAAAAPPTPPASPSPPAPPKEIPASAVQYLESPALEYPRAARRAGESGRVVVRVYIDEGGLPRSVQVNRTSGFARLDEAALAAVQKARFRPYTENGRASAGWALIPLTFDLEK